jgi:hypothetical protein
MNRVRVVVALLVAAGAVPSVAVAHRLATKTERAAIVAAVVKQHELSKAQANCQVVTVSTVNTSFAATSWPKKLSSACLKVAANGVIVEHHQAGVWHLVTVGSSIPCPIKGVPNAVAHDLGVCS